MYVSCVLPDLTVLSCWRDRSLLPSDLPDGVKFVDGGLGELGCLNIAAMDPKLVDTYASVKNILCVVTLCLSLSFSSCLFVPLCPQFTSTLVSQ